MRTLEQELQRHGTALRGLAAALVGEGEADDLLQETALLASLEYEDAGKAVQSTGPTDGDGRLAMRVAPGTYQLFAWRSDMQENETRKEFLSAKPTPEEKAKVRFAVGTLALEPGQTVEREIRLPAAWDR